VLVGQRYYEGGRHTQGRFGSVKEEEFWLAFVGVNTVGWLGAYKVKQRPYMDSSHLVSGVDITTSFHFIVKDVLMVANPNHDTLLFLWGLINQARCNIGEVLSPGRCNLGRVASGHWCWAGHPLSYTVIARV